MRAWIVVALVAVFTLNLFGAPMPKGGRAVLLNEDLFNGKPGGGAASNTEFSEQRVKGPSFTKALRVKTLKPSKQVFFSQLLINIPDAIREEDTLFLRVWMRTVETTYETGKGTLTIGFPSERPDGKSLCRRKIVNFGKEWMCYDMPIILQYGAGKGLETSAF